MNLENKKIVNKEQNIILNSRKKLEISGVIKLENLNPDEFLIHTNLGMLLVKGSSLEMQHLDIEKGFLWITGNISSLDYIDEDEKKKNKEGFLKKLFK